MFEHATEEIERELRTRERKDGEQKDCPQLRKGFLLVSLLATIDVHSYDGD
jgi:hypothetical protein